MNFGIPARAPHLRQVARIQLVRLLLRRDHTLGLARINHDHFVTQPLRRPLRQRRSLQNTPHPIPTPKRTRKADSSVAITRSATTPPRASIMQIELDLIAKSMPQFSMSASRRLRRSTTEQPRTQIDLRRLTLLTAALLHRPLYDT